MNNEIYFEEAASLLSEYTDIKQEWENARIELERHVLKLLENDLQRLYQLLYRIDINEKKAAQAFGSDTKTIAENLTELIMERILQKAKTRYEFRKR